MRAFTSILPLGLSLGLAACSSCGVSGDGGKAPSGAVDPAAAQPMAVPSVAALAPEGGRPILSRAAAFVPADAALVVVFRSWRDAVEQLALRPALDNPLGRSLLEAWKIGGATLTDLPGLANLGMDVDQSLVFAVLPDDTLEVVVASETPDKLLGLFREAAGNEGEVLTVQGRAARAYTLGEARFTVVLHARHVQVLVSRPDTPPETIDNQLQAAFDGAAVWMQRATALPTPQGAAVVAFTPGEPPPPPGATPGIAPSPDDAAGPPPDLMTLLDRFDPLYSTEAQVIALSFPAGEVRLDSVSAVRTPDALRARLGGALSPAQLLGVVPRGASFVSTALLAGGDAAVVRQLLTALPPGTLGGSVTVGDLTNALTPADVPAMFPTSDALRAVVLARFPAQTGSTPAAGGPASGGTTDATTGTLIAVETGALPTPAETLPRLLKAVALAFGKPDAVPAPETCPGATCFGVDFGPRVTCAAAPPLLICGFGAGAPWRESLALLGRGLPPRPTGEELLSAGQVDVPALSATLGAMATSASAPAPLAAALGQLGDDLGTLTLVEGLSADRVTLTVHLGGRGHPVLPSLVPRLAARIAEAMPQ